MQIKDIHYNAEFEEQFQRLPLNIRKKACKSEKILRQNPFHNSLRLHKLKGKLAGLWSVSVDKKDRIIFNRKTGNRWLNHTKNLVIFIAT